MQVTDKILQAAVRKAVEVKLLPKSGFVDVIEENWRKVKAVVEAALAEVDEGQGAPVSEPTNPARCAIAELIRDHVRQTYRSDEPAAIWLLSGADTIARLRAEVATLEKTLELLTSESTPRAVPCVDHPVLDLIARAITPPPRHGSIRYRSSPAEDVTRESECIEFRDTTNGQRFEVIVRPIPDEEDRP